jgi:5-methylcytosine-specific restriction endonuclease McrA
MNSCKYCGNELTKKQLRFCNHSCSAKYNNSKRAERGWTHSPEAIERLRISGKHAATLWENCIKDKETFEKWKSSLRAAWKKKYEDMPFEELSFGKKRSRVIEEQKNSCADCGISEWKSLPINLEIDHKDGNRKNDARENLWALCPNCHSTTETWRGRNINSNKKKVSDAELILALETESSIKKALSSVGLAAKGGNYVRAKALLENISWSGQRA